jgi:ABC-type phosphate/phosphonate transport system ATPase subunit
VIPQKEDVAVVEDLGDISHVYPDATSAVSHLTLHVRHGEVMATVGPSGRGKSTVLRSPSSASNCPAF